MNRSQLVDKTQNLATEDLADAYGATEFENSDEAKKEIQRLNKQIYDENPEIKELWEKGRKKSTES